MISGAAVLAVVDRMRASWKPWVSDGVWDMYRDYSVAVLLFVLAQLLVFGLSFLSVEIAGFSAAIMGMIVLAIGATAASLAARAIWGRGHAVDDFYQRFLRGPTDLLNKHLSIGFTVSFIQILRFPYEDGRGVGRMTAGFLITGVMSPILVYSTVFVLCSIVGRCRATAARRISFYTQARAHSVTQISPPASPAPCPPPPEACPALHPASPPAPPSSGPASPERPSQRDVNRLSHNSAPMDPHDVTDTDDSRNPASGGGSSAQKPTESPPPRPEVSSRAVKVVDWVLRNLVLMLCVISVPVTAATARCLGNTLLLDTSVLFTLWLGSLGLQRAARSTALVSRQARVVLGSTLNPVLVTSLLLVAYLRAKSGIQRVHEGEVLVGFSTGMTFAKFIYNHTAHNPAEPSSPSYSVQPGSGPQDPFTPHSLARANGTAAGSFLLRRVPSPAATGPCLGAGDIAMSILEAGLVSWGLKLFECRRQLFSPAGLLTFLACTVFALAAVASGPLLAHALGLAPAQSLAFAPRSVTIALGAPVLHTLGGDVGANAVMVVLNGVVFQMGMGLGLGRYLARCRDFVGARRALLAAAAQARFGLCEEAGCDLEKGAAATAPGSPRRSADPDAQGVTPRADPPGPATARRRLPPEAGQPPDASADQDDQDGADDVEGPCTALTVAAGVTVGINAAAMGTSYLYEQEAKAAPYSALAMTVFGVMTVVFMSVSPLNHWLLGRLGCVDLSCA